MKTPVRSPLISAVWSVYTHVSLVTMGNHGSKKHKIRKPGMESEEVNILKSIDNAEEKGIDSYDKLMAWLLERATHDDEALKSTKFNTGKRCAPARKKRAIWKENSASFDSYTSADTCHLSRSGKSEDFLDLKSRLSVPLSSRQTTVSDDDDVGYDDGKSRPDVPMANRQTTCSEEELCDENNHLVIPLTGRQNATCNNMAQIKGENLDMGAISEHTILVPSKESLTNFDSRDALKRRRDFQKSGKNPIFSASVGQLHDDSIPLASGLAQKSASIAVMRRPTFEREQEMLDTQVSDNCEKVLDDKLLDRNIQDILLSVEVLFHDKS